MSLDYVNISISSKCQNNESVDAHEYPPEDFEYLNLQSRVIHPQQFFSVQEDLSRSILKNSSNQSSDYHSRSRTKTPLQKRSPAKLSSGQKFASNSPFLKNNPQENSARGKKSIPQFIDSGRNSSRRGSIGGYTHHREQSASSYTPLADRFSHMKDALEEKNREVKELKSVNSKLVKEVNTLIGREAERNIEQKSKMGFPGQEQNLNPNNVTEQYKVLYASHQKLLKQHTQIEESLRLETIRGEEQRAYIEILKQTIENHLYTSHLMPYLKKMPSSSQKHPDHRRGESIADVYVDIVGMNSELQKLRKNESELSREVHRLESELKDITFLSEEYKIHLNDHREANERLSNEVQQCINALTVAQNENLKLSQEKDSLLEYIENNKDRMVPKQDFERLAKKNQELQEKLKEIENDYGSLRILCDEIDKQRKQSADQLYEKERGIEVVKRERDHVYNLLKDQDEIATRRNQEIQELNHKLTDRTVQLQGMEHSLKTMNENYSTLNTTLHETQTELEQAREKSKNLEIEVKSLREQLETIRITYAQDTLKQNMTSKDLEREIATLQTKVEEGEKVRAALLHEKINLDREKLLIREETRTSNEQINMIKEENKILLVENDKIRYENRRLAEEMNNLKNEIENNLRNLVSSNNEIEDLVKRCEEKDKTIKKLKDQLNLSEKEIQILRGQANRVESLKASDSRLHESLRGENKSLHEKIESLNYQLAMAKENENNLLEDLNKLQRDISQSDSYFNGIIRDLNITLDMLMTEEERRSDLKSYDSNPLDTQERKCKEITRLINVLRKEIDNLSTKYTQAKLELLKEMEWRNSESAFFSEQKVDLQLTTEVEELKNEKRNLLQKNETLRKQLVKLEQDNNVLVQDVERAKLRFDPRGQDPEIGTHINEIRVKEYLLMRLRSFIFNPEVLEVLEELGHCYEDLLNLEKEKFRIQFNDSSYGSLEKMRGQLGETKYDEIAIIKMREIEESIEALKMRKNNIEGDLYKLEVQEKRKHDSTYVLEKQNFQLKNEVSRLMNEIEVNFSKYNDTNSEYYSHKMNERQNVIGEGYHPYGYRSDVQDSYVLSAESKSNNKPELNYSKYTYLQSNRRNSLKREDLN